MVDIVKQPGRLRRAPENFLSEAEIKAVGEGRRDFLRKSFLTAAGAAMAVPILMVVFVLAFIGTIIEYPVASILLREEANLTLAVGSKFYLNDQKFLWGDFAAAAVLSGLPITLVFLAAQRWIVSGLTAGGVKG